MDPHEPFLKAILADRHDDLPRLVYADWLEESGEPSNVARAHFIRTQINLESADPKSELFAEMKALEARILDWYLDEWRHELPDPFWSDSEIERVVWRRGFADDLGPMSVHRFQRYGVPALRELPLTTVHLDHYSVMLFEEVAEFGHVSRLKLGPNFGAVIDVDDGPSVTFDSLLSAPVFTALRTLDLSENRLTDAWLVRFAARFPAASFAPTLESLDLSGNFSITDAGANVLATAPGLDALKMLRLRDTGVSKAGVGMLRKRFGPRLR